MIYQAIICVRFMRKCTSLNLPKLDAPITRN